MTFEAIPDGSIISVINVSGGDPHHDLVYGQVSWNGFSVVLERKGMEKIKTRTYKYNKS